ncbi:hypothetical protein BpHYR1_021230 [Brachionus plicatilis]|uniref:Uncharacterized protein n=1 Tax=Brachionus plicatilis TaxID=10195 RepID=A0A3M7T2K8_BRAPC|nr:hypothetical protein BpHYR1_021230 [Brachionus plicatilis]
MLSYNNIGKDIPIQANRKKGRPKYTAGAFKHRQQEIQASTSAPKRIESDDDSNVESIQEIQETKNIFSYTRNVL